MGKILVEQNGSTREVSYEEFLEIQGNPDYMVEQVSSGNGDKKYVVKTRLMG